MKNKRITVSLPPLLLAGSGGQLCRVGEAHEGPGIGGRRQPLHRGHEPGDSDVQANRHRQGNGTPGGVMSSFPPRCIIIQ